MLLREVINDATKEWRDFVRGELAKGGGVLYKYISKEEKAYLNIDISKFCVSNFSPSEVLSQQAKNWSKLWAPANPSLQQCCLESLKAFYEYASIVTVIILLPLLTIGMGSKAIPGSPLESTSGEPASLKCCRIFVQAC